MQSTAPTHERAIAGVTHGLIELGETVTWQGRHFGLVLQHETKITQYDKPRHFQDVMVRGTFRSFVHDHYFEPAPEGYTMMRDVLRFAAPLGPFGRIAEALVLKPYLCRFLVARNQAIRTIAESSPEVWEPFVSRDPNGRML